jgi:hypothetical protein
MWTPQKLSDGTDTEYGLGFGVRMTDDGKLRVSHSGGQEKTRTMMIISPGEKRGIVLMTNSEWVNPRQLANEIVRELLRK